MYTFLKNLSEEHIASDRTKVCFQNSSPCPSKSDSLPDWVFHFSRLKLLAPPSLNLPSSFLNVQLDTCKSSPVLPPFGLWCSSLIPAPHPPITPSGPPTAAAASLLSLPNTEGKILLILIIHRFHICERVCSLKCTGNPPNQYIPDASQSSLGICRAEQKLSPPTGRFPADANQGDALPPCFSSYCKQGSFSWPV